MIKLNTTASPAIHRSHLSCGKEIKESGSGRAVPAWVGSCLLNTLISPARGAQRGFNPPEISRHCHSRAPRAPGCGGTPRSPGPTSASLGLRPPQRPLRQPPPGRCFWGRRAPARHAEPSPGGAGRSRPPPAPRAPLFFC